MKRSLVLALFVALALKLVAADAAPSKTQDGRLSVVSLLATQRISGKGAPDGIRFLFLVQRKPETKGQFAIQETRDFQLNGESYQGKTQAEHGSTFEPATVFDTAAAFFAKNPGARQFAPDDVNDAYVLTVAIAGAKIEGPAVGTIVLHVGFDQEVEPFTFRFNLRPGQKAPSK